ncbi:MAG: helix-turn-helix domain-containing protein [Nitrospirae bacterium]|nr:helix-turn-helix domain-containing protein [Nitrospirota bacterium]
MKDDDKRESIGNYLKKIREQLGFTLQDISSKTKISLAYLEYLENEEFSLLPNEVFIKGFLRSYAKVLGLSEMEMLERFQQWKFSHETMNPAMAENQVTGREEPPHSWPNIQLDKIKSLYETRRGFRRSFLFNLLIGTVIVLGGVILFAKRNNVETQLKEEEALSSKITSPAVPEAVAPATATSSSFGGSFVEKTDKPVPKGPVLRLTVQATERSWISVVVDDGITKEFSLHPEDKITLEADKRFLLNIGNAGGVQLTLNGKALGPFGKKGEIVKGIKLEETH